LHLPRGRSIDGFPSGVRAGLRPFFQNSPSKQRIETTARSENAFHPIFQLTSIRPFVST